MKTRSANPVLIAGDLAILIKSNNINPDYINIKNLKNEGVISGSFILQSEVISSESKVYIDFENDVTLEINHGRIIFTESIFPEKWGKAFIPKLSSLFIKIYKDFNYNQIEFRPSSLYRFDSNSQRNPSAKKYLTETLKPPLIVGLEPPLGSLKFNYQLEECNFELEIKDLTFNANQELSETSGVLCSGSFIYNEDTFLLKNTTLTPYSLEDKLNQNIHLYKLVANKMIAEQK